MWCLGDSASWSVPLSTSLQSVARGVFQEYKECRQKTLERLKYQEADMKNRLEIEAQSSIARHVEATHPEISNIDSSRPVLGHNVFALPRRGW